MNPMQSVRLPSVPNLHASFRKHRSDLDQQSRHALSLNLPMPHAMPTWAYLPSPPMSASPAKEFPFEPQQLAGHRRKRSDTPHSTSTAGSASAAQSLLDHAAQSDRSLHSRVSSMQSTTSLYNPNYAPSYHHASQPYIYAANAVNVASAPPFVDSYYVSGQFQPRATRRAKAHVASACVNCKRKHLRCDSARPCNRCVQSGNESTCIDVEPKKRGRPPLKAEDASHRRSFEPAQALMSRALADPSRRLPPAGPNSYSQASNSFQRMLRPAQPDYPREHAPSSYRPGTPYQMTYGHATGGNSDAAATAAMPMIERSQMEAHPSAYGNQYEQSRPSPMGHSHSSSHGGPEQHARPMSPYSATYSYQQSSQSMMPPPSQTPYHYSNLFTPTKAPFSPPPVTRVDPHRTSALQLPPILANPALASPAGPEEPPQPHIQPQQEQRYEIEQDHTNHMEHQQAQTHHMEHRQAPTHHMEHRQASTQNEQAQDEQRYAVEQQSKPEQESQYDGQPREEVHAEDDQSQSRPATATAPVEEEADDGTTRPDAKRPKMDIGGILGSWAD